MVDTHAYFGQPGVFPQFGPQTLMPQSQFGVTPGQYGQQYGQSLGQLIAACLAQQHLAAQLGAAIGQPGRLSPFDGGFQTLGQTAFAPYAAFTGLPSQYAPPMGQPMGGWRDIHSPAALRPKDPLDLPRDRLELLRDLDLPRDCLDRLRVSSAAFQASPALCRASFRRCSGSAVGGPAALTPLALERRGVSGDSL